MAEITQDYLKVCLDYDPDAGIFTWKSRPKDHFKTDTPSWKIWNARFPGKEAGYCRRDGYFVIKLFEYPYLFHRLAWLWMTGDWPKDQIDHIDHCPTNNKWSNLREANIKENGRNKSINSNNTSGHTGVGRDKSSKKWYAKITSNRKHIHLGLFDDIEDAVAARAKANIKYGFHPNHGH